MEDSLSDCKDGRRAGATGRPSDRCLLVSVPWAQPHKNIAAYRSDRTDGTESPWFSTEYPTRDAGTGLDTRTINPSGAHSVNTRLRYVERYREVHNPASGCTYAYACVYSLHTPCRLGGAPVLPTQFLSDFQKQGRYCK